MKKIFISILIFIILFLCGCTNISNSIKISDGEILKNGGNSSVKFTVVNESSGEINELSLVAETYDVNNKLLGEIEMSYPLSVDSGKSATLSASEQNDIFSAKAVSFSYKTDSGHTVSHKFSESFTVKEKAQTTKKDISTREELAKALIKDIQSEFNRQGYEAHGSYDPETNQFVMAGYYSYSYKVCKAIYKQDASKWDSIQSSIEAMGKTCSSEFGSYGFSDVHINVGMMSSDEQIMFSYYNGDLINYLQD